MRQRKEKYKKVIWSTFFLLLLGALGCDPENANDEEEMFGRVLLAIQQVPEDVFCIRITATGTSRTEVEYFDVNPGESSAEIDMKGLPLGNVSFAVDSHEMACDQISENDVPIWVSEPVEVSIVKGRVTPVPVVMKRNGLSEVTVDFNDEAACSTNGEECVDDEQCCSGLCENEICTDNTSDICSTNLELVPREALSMGPDGTGGNGLLANYSNGEVVEGEGPIWFGPHESGMVPSWYPADQLADETAPQLWQTIEGIGGETLTGYILAPGTGTVSFNISCDDYCDIEIPGVLSAVADNTGSALVSGEMQAGVWYPITMNYENRWGTNWFSFWWQCL